MVRTLLLILFTTTSLALSAQESWDVERCIEYAWENSLNIQQGQYGVDINKVNLKQNEHQRYPSLSGNANLQLNFGRSIDAFTNDFITESVLNTSYGLNSNVVLWNGSRIRNSIKQSESDLDASMYDVDQAKRDIALAVGTSYLNALFAQENLRLAQQSLTLTEEQLSQIDKLIEAGSRPRNERLDILAQKSNDEQQIVAAENNVAITILALKQQMNLDVQTDIALVPPPENILVETDPDLLSFSEVYESALRNQPNIQAGEMRLKSAEIGVDIAQSGKYPSITGGAGINTRHSNKAFEQQVAGTITDENSVLINNEPALITTTRPDFTSSRKPYFQQLDEFLSYGVGVGANIPIYDNYNTKASVQRAKINALNVKNQNDQLHQTLRTNVQQTLSDARAAKRALKAASNTLEARKAAFDNAESRYKLGAINTFEYVNAKNQFDNSNINYIIAKYDYLFKSKIVDFYMGKKISLD